MMCVEKCDQLKNSRLCKYLRESIGDRADMSGRAESQYSICSVPHVATPSTRHEDRQIHIYFRSSLG